MQTEVGVIAQPGPHTWRVKPVGEFPGDPAMGVAVHRGAGLDGLCGCRALAASLLPHPTVGILELPINVCPVRCTAFRE